MEDLSHIAVPKMHVTEGFSFLSQAVMDGFSDKDSLDYASEMIGLTATSTKEVADEGPVAHDG